MQQKLILPLNRTLVTASMGNAAYRAKFGFPHYGTDMVSAVGDTTIYASGTGTLIAAGWDKYAGNVVVIRYPGAVYRPDGTAADVIFRYFHLAEIGKIPAGENAITKDTILGRYGGSGMGSKSYWSPHLHVEADTDVRYPRYSPTFTPAGRSCSDGLPAPLPQPCGTVWTISTAKPPHPTVRPTRRQVRPMWIRRTLPFRCCLSRQTVPDREKSPAGLLRQGIFYGKQPAFYAMAGLQGSGSGAHRRRSAQSAPWSGGAGRHRSPA